MPELNLLPKTTRVVRGPMDELDRAEPMRNASMVNRAIAFADQETDVEQGKELALARFGYGIALEEDVLGQASGNEIYTTLSRQQGRISFGGHTTYVRPAEQLKIDQGFYPFISTGLFPQIVGATSTLFTQDDQHWDFLKDEINEEDGKPIRAGDVAEAVMNYRIGGNFAQAIETVDYVSSSVESAILHIYLYGYRLWYDPVLPTNIHVVFGDRVTEFSDEDSVNGVERAVNNQNIDDASIVVIRLGDVKTAADDGNTKKQARWAAYIGKNETPGYELGRFVTYTQADYWPIPPLDTDQEDVFDYRHIEPGQSTGPICNPLTYIKEEGKELAELTRAEYPVSILRGGVRKVVDELLPTSTSLYESCLEIELAWSRLLHGCSESMSGIDVIGLAPGSVEIPKSLKKVVLRANQTFQHFDTASGSEQAQVLQIITTEISQGRNVPGYMVIGSPNVQPESGISLAIQSAPLITFRGKRYRVNADSIERIFEIEKGIIGEYRGMVAKPLLGVKQIHDPGTWNPPRDEATRTEEIVADREAELIDHPEAVRRKHKLKTVAEAEDLILEYEQRDPDYGSSPPAQPPGTQLAPPQLTEPPEEPEEETEEEEDDEAN
jgi:hypothetical protein